MRAAGDDIEYELQLTGPPERLERAFLALELGRDGGRLGRPGHAERLAAVYHDTTDGRLRRHGAALRVRSEGGRFAQTLKVDRGPLVRLEETVEVEELAPELDRLPEGLLARTVGAVFAEELVPIFATDVERRTRRLTLPAADGGTGEVEIAFDRGEIRAGDRREPVTEVEIELLRGSRDAVFAAAEALVAEGAARLVTRSKAVRGHDLAAERGPGWAKAERTTITPDLATGDALGRLFDGVLRQLWANHDAAFDGRDPEGVHQLRVGVRRLRSLLTLFGKLVARERLAWLQGEARWLMSELGPVRDRDVFATETLPPVARSRPNDAALAALRATAEDAREHAYARLRETMASPRYTRFVLMLAQWVGERGWWAEADAARRRALAEPIGPAARRVLDKRAKVVRKRGRSFAELDSEQRHEVRKSLKKLRYAADFLRSLHPDKGTKRYLKRLAALQDAFGHMNDMATAETLLDRLVDGTDPRLAEGRGLVLGWYAHAASVGEAELLRDWDAFVETRPFWREADGC